MTTAAKSDLTVSPPTSASVTLRAEGPGKEYGGVTVLSNVTLDIRTGEIHAIIGENGAGKSMPMKLLSGHVPATTGQFTGQAPMHGSFLLDAPLIAPGTRTSSTSSLRRSDNQAMPGEPDVASTSRHRRHR